MPRPVHTYNTSSEARAVYDRLVHFYSYKPEPIISRRNREADSALTFGLELETEMRPSEYSVDAAASCAQCISDISAGRVYLKRDSSVSSGFEIVSHPATLASHMYDAHWSGIVSKAKKHGFRSHDAKTWGGSCGLHVHVGRKQLGRDDWERNDVIRKVKVLVYRHWGPMVVFSRRSQNQLDWCSRELSANTLDRLSLVDNAAAFAADNISIGNTHDGRYIAVNCENAATIEFRLFNGTLKRDTLIATLQLVSNICRYAMTHSWDEVLASSFLAVALCERYNELDTYLAARGLAAESDVTGRAQNTQRIPSHHGYDGIEA